MRILNSLLARRELLLAGAGALALGACGGRGGGLPPQTLPARAHEVATHEVRFSNGGVALAGTVYMPVGLDGVPGVVFGHGSGDVSRPNRRFTFEAEGLAARGIACLVFDKRGCGQSSGDWKTSTFQDLAGDLRDAKHYKSNTITERPGSGEGPQACRPRVAPSMPAAWFRPSTMRCVSAGP